LNLGEHPSDSVMLFILLEPNACLHWLGETCRRRGSPSTVQGVVSPLFLSPCLYLTMTMSLSEFCPPALPFFPNETRTYILPPHISS